MKPMLISILISMLATSLLPDPANIHDALGSAQTAIGALVQIIKS